MKISQAIERLTKMQAELGDVHVMLEREHNGHYSFHQIEHIVEGRPADGGAAALLVPTGQL